MSFSASLAFLLVFLSCKETLNKREEREMRGTEIKANVLFVSLKTQVFFSAYSREPLTKLMMDSL